METTDNTMETWKKVLIGALVIAVLYFAAAFMFDLWPFGGGSSEDETEQVDPTPIPAPIVQIEVPASAITGEYPYSNISADDQKLLTEVANPNLNGEKIMVAHKITGFYPSTTMYWIQTQAADGSVRNIFTDEMYVKVK